MKPSQLKLWARKAFKKRYGFYRVTIKTDGRMYGHYDPTDRVLPAQLGFIQDCYLTKDEHGAQRLCLRGQVVYTFPLANGEPNDQLA